MSWKPAGRIGFAIVFCAYCVAVLREASGEQLFILIVAACFLVGLVVARWWAPLLALVLVAAEALPARCVTDHLYSDVLVTTCSNLDNALAPMVGISALFILAGVVTTRAVVTGVTG